MKLPLISGIDVIKRLKKAGFIATRQRGSHVRLEKYVGDKTIKLTVPLHDELKKGTLNRIIKDAGLTLEEFEKWNDMGGIWKGVLVYDLIKSPTLCAFFFTVL